MYEDNLIYNFNQIKLDIWNERVRQEQKWYPNSNMPNPFVHVHEKIAVLAEEFGEVVKEALDGKPFGDPLRAELVQVAAVAVAWIEAIDRHKDGVYTKHMTNGSSIGTFLEDIIGEENAIS